LALRINYSDFFRPIVPPRLHSAQTSTPGLPITARRRADLFRRRLRHATKIAPVGVDRFRVEFSDLGFCVGGLVEDSGRVVTLIVASPSLPLPTSRKQLSELTQYLIVFVCGDFADLIYQSRLVHSSKLIKHYFALLPAETHLNTEFIVFSL
jgi:hypothetical protein